MFISVWVLLAVAVIVISSFYSVQKQHAKEIAALNSRLAGLAKQADKINEMGDLQGHTEYFIQCLDRLARAERNYFSCDPDFPGLVGADLTPKEREEKLLAEAQSAKRDLMKFSNRLTHILISMETK
ncbi:hypothetical protein BSY48_004433 [Salmonella enterica subsp. enterica serovar Agbeni]|nr:hypothetical protein [Salmonella enterica subsp. enterica serovar Agbeni]